MKIVTTVGMLVMTMTTLAGSAAAAYLDRPLQEIVASGDPLAAAADRGFAVRDGRVQVVAVSPDPDTRALEAWLGSRGATFIVPWRGRVQAFVPPALLSELERRPDVAFVERPMYAELPEPAPPAAEVKTSTLAVTSEGVVALNSEAWNAEGTTGAGVRVAVIDPEFGGWQDLLGVELPPAERTTYRAFGGSDVDPGQVHGTACAEIVHDIAPDAHLYLAHISTLNDLFNALDWLASEGVDVVTISVGWYGTGPGDGTGQIANEIEAFMAATDSLFFTSAGNERRSHWQGVTVDADGDGWVEFAPGIEINELSSTIAAGDRVAVNMSWNDWSSPTSDYDLYLYNLDGPEPVQVASSTRLQNGQSLQRPFESISYTAADGGRFGFRVDRSKVTGSHDLEVFSLDSDIDVRVGEGSITIPADAEPVIAVASVSYTSPYGVRNYSSAGPANGPGGRFTGGIIKPDIAGYDGVSTVSYGGRNFYGTSAASPHAAGAAALVRQAEPGWDRDEVRGFLVGRAVDLGPTGKDNDTGWGRTFLGQTPNSTCTFAIDPTSASAPIGGGGGIVQVAAQAGCPWTTSSLDGWLTVAPAAGVGPGVVGYTVDANPGPAARTGQMIIAGIAFSVNQDGATTQVTTMVAGIAETEGAAQTRWKSDLAIFNPASAPVDVELRYHHDLGTVLSSVSVGAGALVELANVAVDTFNAPGSSGSVELIAPSDLVVTARTYNDAPDGTFGQFLPGVTAADGLAGDATAVLTQLNSGAGFRTNVGFVDVGGTGAVVRVRLFDSAGLAVGTPLSEIVGPGGWVQVNRVFRESGAGACAGCYALVDLIGGDGAVWAYASVVDNASGDPTTVPMVVADASGSAGVERSMVAGVAETEGANQTRWKSNLALLNLAGETVVAELRYRYDGGEADTLLTLADRELVELSDVARVTFGAPGTAGAVEVEAALPLVVTARTFNDSTAGTYGQYLPGLGADGALKPTDVGLLTQIKSTDQFRTNVGFTNYSARECTVRTDLFDQDGQPRGRLFTTVPAGGWTQVNRIFVASGGAPCPLGFAEVRVLTADCRVWAYASVVDNGSGDPTTVPVVRR